MAGHVNLTIFLGRSFFEGSVMAKFYDNNSNMKDMNIFTEDMSKPGCVPMGDFVKIVKDPTSGLKPTYEYGIGKIDQQISKDSSFVKSQISKNRE